jgi:transposase
MTLEDKVQALRLHAFRRAEEFGNVSAACRELGLSRSLFYRGKQRFERYRPDGLHPARRKARPGRPPAVPAHIGRSAIALALAWPTWGPNRLSIQLARQGVEIAPSSVYRTLRRVDLGTRRERLVVLEHYSARRAGLLTERTRRRLHAARHVEASAPGALVCLDCF